MQLVVLSAVMMEAMMLPIICKIVFQVSFFIMVSLLVEHFLQGDAKGRLQPSSISPQPSSIRHQPSDIIHQPSALSHHSSSLAAVRAAWSGSRRGRVIATLRVRAAVRAAAGIGGGVRLLALQPLLDVDKLSLLQELARADVLLLLLLGQESDVQCLQVLAHVEVLLISSRQLRNFSSTPYTTSGV